MLDVEEIGYSGSGDVHERQPDGAPDGVGKFAVIGSTMLTPLASLRRRNSKQYPAKAMLRQPADRSSLVTIYIILADCTWQMR